MSKHDEFVETYQRLKCEGKFLDEVLDMSEAERDRARKVRDEFEESIDAFKKMSDQLNSMSRDEFHGPAFIAAMLKTHRFLQNKLIIDLLTGIGNYGKMFDEEPNAFADARNEFAMRLCKKVYDALKDDLFWKDKT